jgi:hypothetical protein
MTEQQQHDLDCLSALHGLTIYAEQLEETGEWGVFAENPDDLDETDIAGSGATLDDAIEAAREQLEAWS